MRELITEGNSNSKYRCSCGKLYSTDTESCQDCEVLEIKIMKTTEESLYNVRKTLCGIVEKSYLLSLNKGKTNAK